MTAQPAKGRFILLVSICLLVSLCSPGQDFACQHYDIKDGLVGNHVYHCVQDHDGFLWFATETGVSRFDGSRFKNFTTADGLPDNDVPKLFVDSRNRVWMMPFNNSVCYYYKGRIHSPGNDPVLRELSLKNNLLNIVEDRHGTIILAGGSTLIFIARNGNISSMNRIDGRDFGGISGSGLDKDGEFIAYLGIGSKIQGTFTHAVIRYKSHPILYQLSGTRPASLSISNFIYFHDTCMIVYDRTHKATDHIKISDYYEKNNRIYPAKYNINSITGITDSLLYLNTKSGTTLYNYKHNRVLHVYLSGESTSSTMQDNEGNLWFTTLGNGIFRLPPSGIRNISFAGGLKNQTQIQSLHATPEKLYAGSSERVAYLINGKTGTIEKKREVAPHETGKIFKIAQLGQKIYIASEFGFFSTDVAFGRCKNEGRAQIATAAKDMALLNTDTSVFALSNSVIMNKHRNDREQYAVLHLERGTAICAVSGGIFIGTLQGLYFKNFREDKLNNLSLRETLLRSRITKLLFHRGNLWIGTNNNGVLCYNGHRVIKTISTANGLTGNIIRALYADSNYLWVGTDRGLNKIDIGDTACPVVSRYTTADGLASDMINAVCTSGPMVYVGTPSGISFFNGPDATLHSRCDLKILGVTVSGKTRETGTAALQLQPHENNIRIDFVAISYNSAGDIRYRYRLQGLDKEWHTTRANVLEYPSLPSGSYELQLEAINKHSKKSEMVAFRFRIEKKLTEKTWFWLALAALVAFGAGLYFRHRIKRIRRKGLEQKMTNDKIAELEQLALKAQMNPHFIFNCLNSIQQYVIEKDLTGANKFIANFSKLIRQTLDYSGKDRITIAEEVSFLNNYLSLEQIRFEGKFDFSVSAGSNLDQHDRFIPPMLLQPFVENSIRHGIRLKADNSGRIDINMTDDGSSFRVSVVDNGVGRAIAQQARGSGEIMYQSKGMSLTSQRIDMMNKTLEQKITLTVEDLMQAGGKPAGTAVTINFPKHFTT